MKTYAPKGLSGADLRPMMEELFASPAQVAKFLKVTERSVWRWLSDGSAPYAVLAALWHETPTGREHSHCDVGNDLVIQRGLARAHGAALEKETARLGRVLSISDTGAANDPLMDGPLSRHPVAPLGLYPRPEARKLPDDGRRNDGASDNESRLIN